eukprot:TRINITY_DN5837_c0_g1_i1.p1 TRINITY_DN5837_c0_g1~~TRINITY_DN5837_c0_g1_i1.p1  ORF type:complete len:527 (+),score=186.50 TRINITY_DN5837_c0_g1_i1:61-1581(+)
MGSCGSSDGAKRPPPGGGQRQRGAPPAAAAAPGSRAPPRAGAPAAVPPPEAAAPAAAPRTDAAPAPAAAPGAPVPAEAARSPAAPAATVPQAGGTPEAPPAPAPCADAVERLLRSGAIALVRGEYFTSISSKPGVTFPKRQEMDPAHLWPPEQAVALWQEWGARFFHAVSYGWVTAEHPDPNRFHVKRIARVLKERRKLLPTKMPDLAVMLDWCSLHQGDERSAEEDALYQAALRCMGSVFSHEHVTVLRFSALPPDCEVPFAERGWPLFEHRVADSKPDSHGKLYDYTPQFDPSARFVNFSEFFAVRHPPLSPADFAAALQGRRLRVESDRAELLRMYEHRFEEFAQVGRLDCSEAGWGPAEGRQLAAALPLFRRAAEVSVARNELGDKGADAVLGAAGCMPWLRALDLSGNGIRSIGGLERLRHLEELVLTGNQLQSEAAEALRAALSQLPQLQKLYLAYNGLPPAVGERLRAEWVAQGKDADSIQLQVGSAVSLGSMRRSGTL